MKKTIKVEFAIDEGKALKIAERLFDRFYNRQGFFKDYTMPEYVLPRNLKKGTREHALFLTYVISIDYMTDAVKLWKKSRGAYELYPERFTPEELLKVNPRTMQTFVKRLGARFYLNAMTSQQRREWADKVFDQMRNRLKLEDHKVFFHAGKRYREHLIPMLEDMGIRYEIPLKGLGIGKQMAWYKEHDCYRS